MITVSSHTVDEIFALIDTAPRGRYVLPNGHVFRNSARIKLFRTKGIKCVQCGCEGSVFVLEAHREDIPPHLNLYAVGVQGRHAGKMVLMTKDHIVPKSKGGANALSNYAPMCSPCNGLKADKV